MRLPRAALAASAAALAIALTGCGGDDDDGMSSSSGSDSTSAPKASGKSTDKISIKDFLYEPADVSVSAGTEVTFTNEDSANHTATGNDGGFDTGTLGKGDSKAITIDEPGTYAYICSFHAFMKGQITVEG